MTADVFAAGASAASQAPLVAVGPSSRHRPWTDEAVRAGGGRPIGVDDDEMTNADGVVWLDSRDAPGLQRVFDRGTQIRWVQLPTAGVEHFAKAGMLDGSRMWTCAKGTYAEPVAEHALTLALTGLRDLRSHLRAGRWGAVGGASLYDQDVTIVGAGGICEALLALLAPFRSHVTVVRRSTAPLAGVHRTVGIDDLDSALPGALVVFLALALTPETVGIIGAAQLARMDRRAWLVNVARGPLVDTPALVRALHEGTIGGAALDVTDPEPLPEGHPLWSAENCIITPHSACNPVVTEPLLARRIAENVRRLAAGEPLEGLVDAASGY